MVVEEELYITAQHIARSDRCTSPKKLPHMLKEADGSPPPVALGCRRCCVGKSSWNLRQGRGRRALSSRLAVVGAGWTRGQCRTAAGSGGTAANGLGRPSGSALAVG